MPDYNPLSEKEAKDFDKWKALPPRFETHGTEEDIRANLTPMKAKSWRLEGNMLIAETELGNFGQKIPTDYICKGMDSEGLPILVKVV